MQSDEVKKLLFDLLCMEFDRGGDDFVLPATILYKQINNNEYVKDNGGVTLGLVKACLTKLVHENLVYYSLEKKEYIAHRDDYLRWSDSKGTNARFFSGNVWTPLQVKNHEEVADEIDKVADLLAAENGYVASHSLEAEHTIAISKNLSLSLRNNKGTTLIKFVDYTIILLKRVIEIFDTGSRVGKIVDELIKFILSMISR